METQSAMEEVGCSYSFHVLEFVMPIMIKHLDQVMQVEQSSNHFHIASSKNEKTGMADAIILIANPPFWHLRVAGTFH